MQSGKCSRLLLEGCQYAQWVPNSDAVVAQNDRSLVIWYNVCDLEARKIFTELDDFQIQGIERDGVKYALSVIALSCLRADAFLGRKS